MARLQDFQQVTPSSSDNLLVVQATGQGLATVGSTLGAKLDKANPTGTGSLSINRKSGTTEGGYSVATGYQATASGGYSQAGGYRTVASGTSTSALGTETIANHAAQHVFGMYNLADTSAAAATAKGNYIEIVGNGASDSARSNARTLDWSGNEVLAGDLTINGNTSVGDKIQYIGHVKFNSSNPAYIPKLATQAYGLYIVFGVFMNVGSLPLAIEISNNSVSSVKNLLTGAAWSNSNFTFSYNSSTGLKCQSSLSGDTIITWLKSE